MIEPDMIEIEAIRERHKSIGRQLDSLDRHRAVVDSAADVPRLLEIIDAVSPLVRAARLFTLSEGDKDTMEALVEVSDTLEWSVLDALGIVEDDEDY